MDRTRWYVALATRYVRYTFINILSRSNQSNGRRGEEGKKKRNVRETMTHDPRWINPRPKKNPSSLRSRNPLRSGNQNICPRAIDFRRGEKKKGEILLSRVKKKKRGEASSTTRVERSNCRNNRHPVFVKWNFIPACTFSSSSTPFSPVYSWHPPPLGFVLHPRP